MSAAIRAKSQWFDKITDEVFRKRCISEARGQKLTDKEIDYVFDELKYYASLRVPGSGVEPSGVDYVWISDALVGEETTNKLRAYAATLENGREECKDWHPNSNGQVLDLVNPSLYPLNYKKSSFLTAPIPSPEAASERFCWLPTEFGVDEYGAVTIESYINNLHPVKHAALYPTIARVVSYFVPMVEQVVTDIVHRRGRRVVPDFHRWYKRNHPERDHGDDDDGYGDDYGRSQVFIPPQPDTFVTPDRPTIPYSLRGRRLQVIVKMSNIYLTPESPTYEGGNWEARGMANERIVATGIYYYDVENIAESSLEFRESVQEFWEYSREDFRGTSLAYDIFDGVANPDFVTLEQRAGQVEIKSGRCICFPNTYQHKVSGFKLADPTKPGHRKVIEFFFIDPATRIPSTEIVPPQQMDWWADDALVAGHLHKLPPNIRDTIKDNVDFPVSLEKAKDMCLELTKEHDKMNTSLWGYFAQSFYF
ncbi:hypothetical protein GQ54DRAFT_263149 [Martensiomyces pterosporus]|nr:hypothetical protein GQ54DRAFT_263149 [Martensiomyces pterosporus]